MCQFSFIIYALNIAAAPSDKFRLWTEPRRADCGDSLKKESADSEPEESADSEPEERADSEPPQFLCCIEGSLLYTVVLLIHEPRQRSENLSVPSGCSDAQSPYQHRERIRLTEGDASSKTSELHTR